MKKNFYDHIVKSDSVICELENLNLDSKERKHLESLIESTVHHEIIDAILSELSQKDKKIFLQHLSSENHEKIWEHLMNKVDTIEEKIKKAAEDLKKKLHKDIEDTKKKSK